MKIIIIDARAEALAAELRQAFGDLEIEGFADPEQGIEAIGSRAPDLATVDIDIASIGRLADLRGPAGPETEFILLSEWTAFAYEAFRFGAADFLLKPLRSGELVQSFGKVAQRVKDKWLIKNRMGEKD